MAERFWAKVVKTDGCWLWTGSSVADGSYGQMRWGGEAQAPKMLAHRISYEMVHGPVFDGMVVMHSCDNPKCVNPDHLSAGFPSDNALDCVSKGRWRRGSNDPIPEEKKTAVLELLASGVSKKSAARLVGISRTSVARLAKSATHASTPSR